MSDDELITQSAIDVLQSLETPINGVPSVRVVNRANAERLIRAALQAVWSKVLSNEQER